MKIEWKKVTRQLFQLSYKLNRNVARQLLHTSAAFCIKSTIWPIKIVWRFFIEKKNFAELINILVIKRPAIDRVRAILIWQQICPQSSRSSSQVCSLWFRLRDRDGHLCPSNNNANNKLERSIGVHRSESPKHISHFVGSWFRGHKF
jgi:hypothetical protein